jgi:type VI secretion system protein ImpC
METIMPGRLEFDVNFSTATQGKRRRSETSPMHILLMGNFSGMKTAVTGFPVHALDLDNFDALMAKLAPRLELDIGNPPSQRIEIEFHSLDDFHPDALFDRLPLFQHLKSLRSNLNNPATFEQAAAQLTLEDVSTADNAVPETHETQASTDTSGQDANPLDELLSGRPAQIAAEPTAVGSGKAVDISAFIRSAVAPHIEPGPNPQKDSYIASVDETISELMRSILHHPQFQALEAVWRSANECIARLELDESLKLFILDASKEQLQQDLQQAAQDLSTSMLYQSLVEKSVQTLGGESWSLWVGLYSFNACSEDIECLKALAQVARQGGGPFVAAADAGLLGCESLASQPDPRQWQALDEKQQAAWNALRVHPNAGWLGLVFPRFLLRLPYGAKAEQIERFEFEELPAQTTGQQRHDSCLWANGALATALLIGQSFQHNSWSMQLGDVLEVDDLPWHVYELHGEKTITPCAEALMSERAAEHIEGYGVMPLMSYKNKNAVRLWRFRSLAREDTALAGPWAD